MDTPIQYVSRQIEELRTVGKAQGATLDDIRRWSENVDAAIHVAVMVEPYLSKVVQGDKYIESRLTKVNIAPFARACEGDVILFKRSGGALSAIAEVSHVQFELLNSTRDLLRIVAEHADGLSYEEDYAASKSAARYASLLWLRDVKRIVDMPLAKQSRQAWLTFVPPSQAQRMTSCPDLPLF